MLILFWAFRLKNGTTLEDRHQSKRNKTLVTDPQEDEFR